MSARTDKPAAQSPLRPTLIALSLCSALLAACSGDKPAPAAAAAPPALPVTVIEARPESLPATLELMGQTEGPRETEVRARVGGLILKRLYAEGEPVRAGQPLFQIDPAPYDIALAEARARAEQAAREEARLAGLVAEEAVSRKEYDDARTQNAMAAAALRQAELNRTWTTVTAPVAGISGRAVRSEGSLIGAGEGGLLTSIHQTDPLWVRFGLAESDIARLPGGTVSPQTIAGLELVLPDGSVYPQPGRINFLAGTIDTTLGTRQLRAEFANPDSRLLPGQFVRVRLLTGMREGVYRVPQSAVVQTEQTNLVMIADADNKVAPRPVQTAEWLGRDWVISGGLQPGDRIIVDNLMKLRPGAPVAPKAPTPPAGAAPAAAGKP